MTKDKQIELYKELDEKILKITASKREDYADVDVLKNFKAVSAAAQALELDLSDPSQYALFMVVLKIARISNLLNTGKEPNNESLEDSFLDGINYFKLALMCQIDKNGTT